MHARTVLFESNGPAGSPLFKSITDLAREIVKRTQEPQAKEASLVSFLSQILQGQRACPAKTAEAIELAVKHRLGRVPDSEVESWIARVRRAIEMDRLARSDLDEFHPELLYYQLENTAEEASEHFIITAEPVEEIEAPRADPLREILLRRLGLINLKDAPTTSYTFCLPSEDSCVGWWMALFQEIRDTHSASRSLKVKDLIKKLQALERDGNLRLLAVSPALCGVPVVVFNPKNKPTGFVFFYHSIGSKVSIAKMDRPYVEDWKKNVYRRLSDGREKSERVLVPPLQKE